MEDNCKLTKTENIDEIRRITIIGLIGNVVLSIVKFVLGIIGSSHAVVADAVHSLSDLSTDFAILFGVRYWSKPADKDHPYGHKRLETIVTAGISISLFFVSLGIAYRALMLIHNKSVTQPSIVALIAALISLVLKEILFRWTFDVGKRVKSSAVIANAWHHRTDAFSSIPVAVAVGVAIINPHWVVLDRLGAFVVAAFIMHASFRMIKPVWDELMEGGASQSVYKQIKDLVLSVKGVRSTHAIRTRTIGSEMHVDLHILVAGDMSVRKGHDISEEVKLLLVRKMDDVVDVVVHLEPYND